MARSASGIGRLMPDASAVAPILFFFRAASVWNETRLSNNCRPRDPSSDSNAEFKKKRQKRKIPKRTNKHTKQQQILDVTTIIKSITVGPTEFLSFLLVSRLPSFLFCVLFLLRDLTSPDSTLGSPHFTSTSFEKRRSAFSTVYRVLPSFLSPFHSNSPIFMVFHFGLTAFDHL